MRPKPDILFEMPRKRTGWIRYVLATVLVLALVVWNPVSAYDYPPEEYKHTPTVPVYITHGTLGETMRACEQLIFVQNRWGCALLSESGCMVYLPEQGGPVTWATYQRIREHELAHCNGWTHPVRGNVVYPSWAKPSQHLQDRTQ